MRLQPYTWADGVPAFGEPVASDKLLSLPGGEPERWRFPVAAGRVTLTVPTAGEYTTAFRYRTPAGADDPPAKLAVRVRGQRGQTWVTTVRTEGRWSVAHARLTLAAGDTPLTLTGPEVGSVDVWRP